MVFRASDDIGRATSAAKIKVFTAQTFGMD
jgi:hypothetical protein